MLIFLILPTLLFAQSIEIKSLQIYSGGDQIGFPLIEQRGGRQNNITIQFDVASSSMPNLSIVFRFCDQDWKPYSNYFLENPGYNTDNSLWLETLPTSVVKAKYHFKGSYPNENVNFPFSGKWKFYITDNSDTSIVYATGKFFVVRQSVPLDAALSRFRINEILDIPNSANRSFNLSVEFNLPPGLFPNYVKNVEVVENRKLSSPIIINREKYGDVRFYEWNGSDQFKFFARDLLPGNEYRTTDLMDINRFYGPNVNAQLDELETSRFYKLGYDDLGGSSKLLKYKNDYANYLNVQFSLRPPEEDRRIFLTGSFNDWKVLPEFEMKNDDGIYRSNVLLKRGIYDYAYVAAEYYDGVIVDEDWLWLEGNFWETENDYYIFLYYESTENGGYDKIIGYTKITSRGL
ncbi:MAG: DUF5103 domain-containing protein [Melioribacteraceae bacterium]|nr:DUF5103 domain-containing protein [Melioribacteraceae bacterium]